MNAKEIAEKAAQLVSGDREAQHGDKVTNHEKIAALWDAYIRIRPPGPMRGLDVANMMELLKIARRCLGAHNLDDYIDGAGYAACAGEIAERAIYPLRGKTDPFGIIPGGAA